MGKFTFCIKKPSRHFLIKGAWLKVMQEMETLMPVFISKNLTIAFQQN
jgi:hypothetical protein